MWYFVSLLNKKASGKKNVEKQEVGEKDFFADILMCNISIPHSKRTCK